jgi:ribosomal protein S18 acetylase RimI-like enzyme
MDAIVYYRRATTQDAEALAALRMAFLAEVSGAGEDAALQKSIQDYFARAIPKDEIFVFVAVADRKIIASSGLIFHVHAPSNRNPTGREAYIMNMYTMPEWRKRGIASRLLQMLIDHCRQSDCTKISLHVPQTGVRSLYEKSGFRPVETEMRLNLTA